MPAFGNDSNQSIDDLKDFFLALKISSRTDIHDWLKFNPSVPLSRFFYHFKGKNDLARKLIERYLAADDIFFEQLFTRARKLVEDPLQQMLLFLKLLAEAMEQLPDTHPGCLAASFVYESQQFDEEVLNLIEKGITNWRKLFVAQLELINKQYKPKQEYDVTIMADFLTASVEGGIILSLITKDQNQLVQHILHYRNYLKLLYSK